VLTRWQGGTASVAVTLAAIAMVWLDLADPGFRRWWLLHAFTTDVTAGLLVLLLTVLVVDQVVSIRQVSDRSRAVAAQAAIMLAQAERSSSAVTTALTSSGEDDKNDDGHSGGTADADGSGSRDSAGEELRAYMIMLLVGAPVLIDDKVSREFLERAQRLGGEMSRALDPGHRTKSGRRQASEHSPAQSRDKVSDALKRLRASATPLLEVLRPDERAAAGLDDPGSP
jgi:hypothetical protein